MHTCRCIIGFTADRGCTCSIKYRMTGRCIGYMFLTQRFIYGYYIDPCTYVVVTVKHDRIVARSCNLLLYTYHIQYKVIAIDRTYLISL